MVSMYVKLISHMTIPKIHHIQLNSPCLMKNFLVYRTRIRNLDNSREKSSKDNTHSSILLRKGVLYRSVVDNGHKFEAAVVPEDLIHTVLHLGHNQSSHNGYQRTYAAIKCVYYWKGMRKHILVHCKSCPTCAKQRVQKTQFEKQIFEPDVQPMEFHLHRSHW